MIQLEANELTAHVQEHFDPAFAAFQQNFHYDPNTFLAQAHNVPSQSQSASPTRATNHELSLSMPELEAFRSSSAGTRIGAKLFIEEQRAFVEVFCLMEAILLLCRHAESTTGFIQLATAMYFHLNADHRFDEAHPGLRTILFQTLCLLGNPEKVITGLVTIHDRTMSTCLSSLRSS